MFDYDTSKLPEPGIGPFIALSALKKDTKVLGLAPIGIRWRGIVGNKGIIKPEGNCPRSQFVPTTAYVDGKWLNILP